MLSLKTGVKLIKSRNNKLFYGLFNIAFCFYLSLCLFILLIWPSPCFAIPWNNKPLKPIDSQSKLGYINIDWWDNFSDPYLKSYIIQAVEHNHDAKKASWQVEQYRYMVKLQFSQELPSLSVGGTYIGAHFPEQIKGLKNNIFAVPFLASYEADIFLKNHDKTKSSKKAFEASKFQEKSLYISLASDVATSYINVVKLDELISTQQELVNIKGEELKRTASKFKQGTVNFQELNDYKKNYNSAKNTLDEYIKSRDKSLNQLAVLIGESPENATTMKRNSLNNLYYKNKMPDTISSDVIFSRPDILSAEANLEKANIDIRVARKEFLPRINITGIYSLSNIGPDSFGTWGSTIAAILASATLDLFKGGYKVANLKLNKAKYEELFETYRQTDLNAIKEVNDSLIMIKEDSKIDKNNFKNLKLQENNYLRANRSYKNGTISYLELLSEQENFINSVQNQINSKTTCLINYITLYKSAGGKFE